MPSGCRVMDSIVSGQVGRGTVPLSHKIAIILKFPNKLIIIEKYNLMR